jgi:hypothetical protein
MKNIYIGKIVEDYFEMRLFNGVVNDVLDSDKDYWIDFNNSNLSFVF